MAPSAETDFGSLGDFLRSGPGLKESVGTAPVATEAPAARKHVVGSLRAKGLGVALPLKPQRDPFQDGAAINQKVAFKMLKQLGCPVLSTGNGDPQAGDASEMAEQERFYIDVRKKDQPILFQMMLEFGFQPSEAETACIRVEQPRQRVRDELFAALAQKKPPRLPPGGREEEEGAPAAPKPMMSVRAEQELVKRLSERRVSKPVSEAQMARAEAQDPKFRNASEQKAHLERLLRPRVISPATSAQPQKRAASPAANMGHADQSRVVPPVELSRGTVSPSPRLVHAGALTLQSPAKPAAHSTPEAPAEGTQAAATTSAPESLSAGSVQAGAASCEGSTSASHTDAHTQGADTAAPRESRRTEANGRDWLDSILGPTQWPGRPTASRTRAEQQESLKRLAKPRPPSLPPSDDTPAPKRSPRSQQAACSRLSVPRCAQARTPEPTPCEHDQGEQQQSADGVERSGDGSSSSSTAPGVAGLSPAPVTVVIPSVLNQLASGGGGLERIDEDAPPTRMRPNRVGRRGEHPSSVPPPSHPATSSAAPYAAPVVPHAYGVSDPGSRSRRGPTRSRSAHCVREVVKEQSAEGISESLRELMLADPDWAYGIIKSDLGDKGMAGGEEMLETIDRLYNELLEQHGGSSAHASSSSGARRRPSSREAPNRSDADMLEACSMKEYETCADALESTCRMLDRAGDASAQASQEVEQDGEGSEALLSTIDQLYCNLLKAREGLPEEGPTGSCSTATRPLPPVHDPDAEQLRELFDELLWSALMLRRGSDGAIDVQSRLLTWLPHERILQVSAASGAQWIGPSLLQRLSVELPAIHAALVDAASQQGGEHVSAALLLRDVREARDKLLALASSAASAPPEAPPPPSEPESTAQPRPKKPKPRRTSLSHWTPDSLEALAAPPARISQCLAK